MNNAIVYNVPMPVLIKGKFKDTLLVLPIVQLHQIHHFELPFVVKDIEFDPEHWLLGKSKINGNYATTPNVNVYPNPFSNQLFLWLENEPIHQWQVYNSNGQLLKQAETAIMPGDVLEIPFTDFAQGVYHIQFGNSSNIYTKKIIYIKS